jgi:hypothetical protein
MEATRSSETSVYNKPYDAISKKVAFFTVTAEKTSNHAYFMKFPFISMVNISNRIHTTKNVYII